MIDIKELAYEDVINFEKELNDYLKVNLMENYPEIDVDTMVSRFYTNMKKYSEDGSAILLGAFDGEKLIGFHWAHETIFLGKKRMHSYMNGIRIEYRGQHIGSRFFRELEKITKQRGICEIEAFCRASNPVAVNYHLHNGFEIESHRVVKKVID